MEGSDRNPAAWRDEQAALRMILEGTASETGERFFMALVENLARALGTHGAWVTEYLPQARTLRALAFRLGDQWVQDYEHPIDGSPCRVAIEERRLVHYADRVLDLFPDEQRSPAHGGGELHGGAPHRSRRHHPRSSRRYGSAA